MGTISFMQPKSGQFAENQDFSDYDITTLHEVLKNCEPALLAYSQFSLGGNVPKISKALSEAFDVSIRRFKAQMRLLALIDPDAEAAPVYITCPWRPSHLRRLSKMTWGACLASPIAFPKNASSIKRHTLVANILASMYC